jgi:plasmid stability protein
MADVKVRKLEDRVVEYYRRRAERAGHSLEAELRKFLTEGTQKPKRDFAQRVKRRIERLRAKYGELPDSGPGIRGWREGRE